MSNELQSTNTKVFYLSSDNSAIGNSSRLAPAPKITISSDIYYSNDSVIGYSYTVILNGYANALRFNEKPDSALGYGIENVISHIDHIRNIFSCNGGDLHVTDRSNSAILIAKGCTIKSISFENSNNYWVNYAPYTITIECNEIDLIGCLDNTDISCADSFFHTKITGINESNKNYPSDNLVDIKKYKIKEFNDNWTFSIGDEIYKELSTISNNHFNVNYEISAIGRNFYVNSKLIPAWEMAKMFCQDRLYNQIKGLLDETNAKRALPISSDNFNGNTGRQNPNDLFKLDDVASKGLLNDAMSTNYKIYNEIINCDTSEADGSFSLKYSAIVKKFDSSKSLAENAALHNFTVDNSYSDGDSMNVSLSVNGSVTGLVEGGFIDKIDDNFELPASGAFITKKNNNITKYDNAYDSFLAYIKHSANDDLSDSIKTTLNITNANLLLTAHQNLPTSPLPTSFVITHDYNNGIINYNANYDSLNSISNEFGYTNISIVKNYPADVVQEFVVPGRSAGPIIQKLNTKKNGTISISIDGASQANKICGTDTIQICNSIPSLTGIVGLTTLTAINKEDGYIKTKEQYNVNRIDGSFHVELEFICLQ
jgi:hypothetical protein